MITDKIDAYLSKKKAKLIKEDIDSVDVTDSVLELIESLDPSTLDSWQLEMRDKILGLIDTNVLATDEPLLPEEDTGSELNFSELGLNSDPYEEEFSEIQDPSTGEQIYDPSKFYDSQTVWTKKLSEGKKKPATKKKSTKKPEKDINKSKKK